MLLKALGCCALPSEIAILRSKLFKSFEELIVYVWVFSKYRLLPKFTSMFSLSNWWP